MARKKGGSVQGTFGQDLSVENQATMLRDKIQKTLSAVAPLLKEAKELNIELDFDANSDWAKLINLTSSGLPYPMPDGREVMFDLVVIKPHEIKSKTRIHDANQREESALTEDAVSDLIPSIKRSKGNFLPAVGVRASDGIIELMDGRRRSWACYYADSDFRVLIPREDITEEEALYIADISLLSKALSYREQGTSLIKIMEKNGFEQVSDLVIHLHSANYTKSEHEIIRLKVRAAQLPEELLQEIPDYNSLSVSDYKNIRRVYDSVSKSVKSIEEFIKFVEPDMKSAKEQFREESVKIGTIQKSLIDLMTEKSKRFLKVRTKPSTTAVTNELKQYDKKGYYARSKEQKYKKSLEFGKISVGEWEAIKSFAEAVVNEDWDKMKTITSSFQNTEPDSN